MSKRLAADRGRVVREKRALEQAKEKARDEEEQAKEKANNEQCARMLRETGVVEIFEELQNYFPGSEVLWGCEGSRISLVMPKRRVRAYKEVMVESFSGYRDEGYYEYSDHYRHITVRVVNDENHYEHHVFDKEKGVWYKFELMNTDGSHDFGRYGTSGTRRYGIYIGNEWVEDMQILEELIAKKLSLLDDVLKTLPKKV